MSGRELDTAVQNWLNEQGYSFEMRVAQAFKQAGFEVSQFEFYIDPESQDIREIDVVASRTKTKDEITVSIRLLIECKYLKRPWVLFTSPRRFDPFSYFSRILGERRAIQKWTAQESLQGRLLARILLSLGRANVKKYAAFSMPQSAGYSITESLRKDIKAKDNAYIATMQVSKCVEAHDIEVEDIYHNAIVDYEDRLGSRDVGEDKLSLFCSIAFPLVTVKGSLFECCLDENNEIVIAEANNSVLLVSNKYRFDRVKSKPYTSVVRVVTESHIEHFAKEAYEAASVLLSQDQAINELWEHESSKLTRGPKKGEIPF